MTDRLMRRSAFAAALIVTVAWSVAAIAQPGPPGGGPGEEGRHRPRLFISPAGEPFRGPDGLRRWFDGADADHDGAVSRDEFVADAMRFFKVLDRDHDGFIDGVENGAYETEVAPEITRYGLPDEDEAARDDGDRGDRPPRGMFRKRGGGGRGGFAGREGAARYGFLNEPQPVRGADANLDFKVSAEEWAKGARRRFDLLDVAHAGKLRFEDLPPLPGRTPPRR